VDVGAVRKGFDVAVIDSNDHVEVRSRLAVDDVTGWLAERRPEVVGIDSPSAPAPDGERSRACERQIARTICGIRYTPDAETLHATHQTSYFDWILNGFRLYEALAENTVIEVFPTAAWTVWVGQRNGSGRARWSSRGLRKLGLKGVARRASQDERDAIAAAFTARLYPERTNSFGEIVVPAAVPEDFERSVPLYVSPEQVGSLGEPSDRGRILQRSSIATAST
jgi:predicted nuclease with RNAse H fold